MSDLQAKDLKKNKHSLHDHAIQIDIKNVSKSFGNKKVLKGIQLTIEKGEFIAIIGKSGSGKSTLLRLVAGLETLTNGELLFDEVPSSQSTANITMMYQDSRLLPWKKVIENVGLGLKGNWSEKAERVLDAVGLLSLKDQWPSILSGGQKQRVALARALIHEPSLLMLDEPLSALDAFTKLEMQNLVESIWERIGFTALLVTHDVREAIRLADRIILIEDGQIAMDIKVDAPRPRHFSSNNLALLEEKVLTRIMTGETPPNDIERRKLYQV
ncbi:ATP-binding cassette domain-containing protein [Pseudobacillus sp. 179-B 2D1 NHS]|uniref:ATP-binding cassette domain-containing protein n=1 Tax=Pseudobacillus sp. 179-B 2D1 NHS TaxID=3374292 RepID=UPI0038797BF0